eukprot:194681-Rhodomonas_salina.2
MVYAYGATRCAVLSERMVYAYGATRCAVLSERMVYAYGATSSWARQPRTPTPRDRSSVEV